ncbi:polysaccharide pyruvyl transferase CsaB [Pseudalkalibacillus berkeleyi]|uniref:Polysaccharide pyruvyl transferase CsaB n=1 Tax=Pseudalkalibacillus berkeleyi TaxID=1069813 RepID=A0ABS9H4F1_9BACL|nr:polysaccharide pyruvyl transferase CsaB [Pseudalkalibacillus berkeleyi]MCF6138768.1 polysaccharide pyruvyl transferase CsaB [Pseudalkalibacillus berkeleyi]
MKIVISGYYGFDNIGDEAIVFSIIQSLRMIEKNLDIVVLSNNPEKTKSLYNVGAVNRWRLKEVKEAIKSSDGLISGGGSLFQDSTGWKSIPYYGGIIKIAQWLKKPVFIYAQGIGPLKSSLSRAIVRHVMNHSNKITIRDEDSKRLLETVGVKRELEIVPDPVIGIEADYHSQWFKEQSFSKPVITVSVRNWKDHVEFKKIIASELDKFLDRFDAHVVFVPMHGKHDDHASEDIISMMKHSAVVSPFDASIEEKIAIIGQSDLLVGMRLHSLIFAAVKDTPFLAISYDPKIDSFADLCNQRVAGSVEDDDLEGFSEKILEEMSNLDYRLQLMKEPVNKMRGVALETAKKAIDTFRQQ